jgi:hypothetical protein
MENIKTLPSLLHNPIHLQNHFLREGSGVSYAGAIEGLGVSYAGSS